MNEKKLENQLLDAGYPGLFMFGSNSLVEGIWKNGNNKARLENIILSEASSTQAKFLAAEILGKFDYFPGTELNYILVKVYIEALRNTSENSDNKYGLNGNLWGFLYELDDLGFLGARIVHFNLQATPYLKDLLDDDGVVLYDGSREATVGNAYQYRIKDFAAFYLSKIKNIPVDFYQDFGQRDKEIERLKIIRCKHARPKNKWQQSDLIRT